MQHPEVVVTGLGILAPNGVGLNSFWNACLSGISGIRHIQRFDPAQHGIEARVAGEVHVPLPLDGFRAIRKELGKTSSAGLFALAAAMEAVTGAKLSVGQFAARRFGICLANISPSQDPADLEADPQDPLVLFRGAYLTPPALMAKAFDARGPNIVISSACEAGLHAIGLAYEQICAGRADIMLAGGTQGYLGAPLLRCYSRLGALSISSRIPEEACRPFDRNRDGFVLAEGAAMLLLESAAHARERGAEVLAAIDGFAEGCDGYDLTKPDPSGSGMAHISRLALEDASISASDIGYINAHATGTKLGDAAEASALKQLLGDRLEEVPVSATKSMHGHMLAAAGAAETIATIMALRTQLLPPTINLLEVEQPECELNHVANNARPAPSGLSHALKLSAGFGGHSAALVIRKVAGRGA